MKKLRVLVACEESQAVTIAFRERGYEAFSCDLQPCSGGHPEWHLQCDVFEIIDQGWDLMIGHPPCTFISFVGNAWFNEERYGEKAIKRKEDRKDAIDFFMGLWNCPIPFICLENPRGYIQHYLKYSQMIHPYYFGDSTSKATLLWLKNLPKLYHNKTVNLFDQTVTHVHKGETNKAGAEALFGSKIWSLPKEERSRVRSKTFPGIANAMADQWGKYVSEKLAKEV